MSIALSLMHETNVCSFQIIPTSFRNQNISAFTASNLYNGHSKTHLISLDFGYSSNCKFLQRKETHKAREMGSNPIDRREREKKIYIHPFRNNFRRRMTTAFRNGEHAHRSRSRGQPYLYPSRPCTSLFPGARTPTVPSPPADICSVAAPAAATARAGQRHRATARPLYLRRYLTPSPKNSRIPLSCAATGATRSTTNALPTRYVYSSPPPTCPHATSALHALSPRLSPIQLYRTRANRVYIYIYTHTGNAIQTRVCMCVCMPARCSRACKKTRRKRISNGV